MVQKVKQGKDIHEACLPKGSRVCFEVKKGVAWDMELVVEGRKKAFMELFLATVDRQGAAELLDWLEKETDFFTAPASSGNHLAIEGGLCMHSLNVYRRLRPSLNHHSFSHEAATICALLHDICKADYYKKEMRSEKDDKNKWIKVPYYTVEDRFPYGHGEKSVYLIERHMKLTCDEALAIRHHMGGFGCFPGDRTTAEAFKLSALALELHIADMRSTFIDEAMEMTS